MSDIHEVKEICAQKFSDISHELRIFLNTVRSWFEHNPKFVEVKPPLIHSVKSRLKDKDHLAAKIDRKYVGAELDLVADEVFGKITDLAGVRVLLLHQQQFTPVHQELMKKIETNDWILEEQPKAYSWDPDSVSYFQSLNIESHLKESHYTSVHYVVRPRLGSPLVCEIQIRTLFEEIWGEVDHILNYPNPTDNVACREQLRVLAKVVGAGSRLVDSIFMSAEVGFDVKPIVAANVGEIGNPILIQVDPEPTPPALLPPTEPPVEGAPENPELS